MKKLCLIILLQVSATQAFPQYINLVKDSAGGRRDIVCDKRNNIYTSITDGTIAYIYKIDGSTGKLTIMAGGGRDTADGVPATAAIVEPWAYGLAIDTAGNLLYTDFSRIRRIDRFTGLVSTVAGLGGPRTGYNGDGIPATTAMIEAPVDIAVDAHNNIYFTEMTDDVRRVDAVTGIITTVAGNRTRGHSGDGGRATDAHVMNLVGICFDKSGNILVVEDDGYVRRIDVTTGIITTIAGIGLPTTTTAPTGDGGPATAGQFFNPQRIAVDKAGNIYVQEIASIRKIDISSGLISTYAGLGNSLIPSGGSGNFGKAANSVHILPECICFNSCDELLIQDELMVIKVTATTANTPCDPGPNDVAQVQKNHFPFTLIRLAKQ